MASDSSYREVAEGKEGATPARTPPPSRAVAWRGERACVSCLVLSCLIEVKTWRNVTHTWAFWLVNKEREENRDLTVVSLKAINCDWLPITQTFPPGLIYSIAESLFPCARHNTILSSSSCVALCSSLSRSSARIEIGRADLWNPTPCIETPARVCGQSGFWECLPRLLATWIGEIDFFLVVKIDYFLRRSASWWRRSATSYGSSSSW